MNLPDKGMLLDIIKGSAATLALFLATITVPVVGVFPGIFSPLPAIFYGLKRGQGTGFVIVLAATALLALIADPAASFVFLAQGGLIALAFSYFLGKGWGAGKSMIFSVVVTISLILLATAVFCVSQGIDPNEAVRKAISSGMSQSGAFYEKSGLKGEELQALQQGIKEAGALIARIYPALALAGLGVVAGLNLVALKRLAPRLARMPKIGDFRKFRTPDHLIWLPIAAGFALLINNDVVTTTALNFLAVTLPLYFVQGLAIVIHFFDQFRVSRFVRVIFYVLLAMQPYLLIAVAVFGIFDLWGNFRTPKKRENL